MYRDIIKRVLGQIVEEYNYLLGIGLLQQSKKLS
ncbi:MAG: hypothetical protein ACI8ZB_004865 [Desulforhopalus sp.]|jgi:hypothetical protein